MPTALPDAQAAVTPDANPDPRTEPITRTSTRFRIHPDTGVGHVHLRVADLDRAIAFYRDALGLGVVIHGPDRGLPGAAFLAAGDYHHHVALDTWESRGASPAPTGHTGLHHFALRLPNKDALAAVVQSIRRHNHPIDAAQDHGGSVAVYLHDPDGNGIELSYDRPRSHWLDANGEIIVQAEPFDPSDLLTDTTTP
jgi:catechol 2,3-dioxygenase